MTKTRPHVVWYEISDEQTAISVFVANYQHPLHLPRLDVRAWYQWRPDTDMFHGELEFDHDLREGISDSTLKPTYSFAWYYHETARAYIEARILLAVEFVTLYSTGQALREFDLILDDPEPEPEPDPPSGLPWPPMLRDLALGITVFLVTVWAYGLVS